MSFNRISESSLEIIEPESLEQAYTLYKDSLYRFIYRYTQDEQLSIDLVQDTFLKYHNYKKRFDANKSSLKTYLFTIAYQLMINKLKRRQKLKTLLPFLVKEQDHPTGKLDDKMAVQWAIKKLPEKQRVVILLIYYHDMTQEETSVVLEIPIGTVKSRLSSAIKRLREMMEGKTDETQK